MILNLPVLHLWRMELRTISAISTSKGDHCFSLHIASREQFNRMEVMREAKQRFTQEWWEGYLVVELELIGALHMIDGCPLYEEE